MSTVEPEPETYDDKICLVFRELCKRQGDGASPHEVTEEMSKRGWLSPMDTVIDIADLMKALRERGRL